MRLYHGSPRKLKVLKPMRAKGGDEFENQKGIFLTDSFKQAALYSIGKTLKGKSCFALPPNRLVILGSKTPSKGYVYEVNVRAKKGIWNQYVYDKPIKKFKFLEVNSGDFKEYITYVKKKGDLVRICNKEKRKWLKKNGF